MRPAEPCSVSVVATHQLLTNLFEYITVVILSDQRFRRATGSVISEQDLQILEKCNVLNIHALTEIVGGRGFDDIPETASGTERELRAAGDLWADHILENAKAYIMTFVYIFVTVISGYPLFHAIAYGAGLDSSNNWMYLCKCRKASPNVLKHSRITHDHVSVCSALLCSKSFRRRDLFLASSNQYHYLALNPTPPLVASHGRPHCCDRRHPMGGTMC